MELELKSENLISFLRIAFRAGASTGLIEAAHHAGLLEDTKEQKFEDFLQDENVQILIKLYTT